MHDTHLTNQHLVDEHTEAPPVDRSRISRLQEDFGRQKLRRTTERARTVAKTNALLAQAEIGHFQVAVRVQQQIVKFQITFTVEKKTLSLDEGRRVCIDSYTNR